MDKIDSIFVYAADYDEYNAEKEKIDLESVVFIEEKGKEKLITQNKEYNFIPSDGKNGSVLSYNTDKRSPEWIELPKDEDAFELVKLKDGYAIRSTVGDCEASGTYAYAEGYYTNASGSDSHAEGNNTIASGLASHAEGISTKAEGVCSHAEGQHTTASGNHSHTEGWSTNASGNDSHAEGYNTKALGACSHAEGSGAMASGDCSHAEGVSTIASGNRSHAEGSGTMASGDYSHAEGSGTMASGDCSHAEGVSTIANNIYEHASGFLNSSIKNSDNFGDSQNTLFSVGNGLVYNSNRIKHNAFEIKQNGDIYIPDTDAKGEFFQKPMIKLQEALKKTGGETAALSDAEIEEIFNSVKQSS